MPKLKDVKAKTEIHPEYKVPRRIYDIDSKPSKEKPEKIASRFLAKVAPSLA